MEDLSRDFDGSRKSSEVQSLNDQEVENQTNNVMKPNENEDAKQETTQEETNMEQTNQEQTNQELSQEKTNEQNQEETNQEQNQSRETSAEPSNQEADTKTEVENEMEKEKGNLDDFEERRRQRQERRLQSRHSTSKLPSSTTFTSIPTTTTSKTFEYQYKPQSNSFLQTNHTHVSPGSSPSLSPVQVKPVLLRYQPSQSQKVAKTEQIVPATDMLSNPFLKEELSRKSSEERRKAASFRNQPAFEQPGQFNQRS